MRNLGEVRFTRRQAILRFTYKTAIGALIISSVDNVLDQDRLTLLQTPRQSEQAEQAIQSLKRRGMEPVIKALNIVTGIAVTAGLGAVIYEFLDEKSQPLRRP